MPASTEEPETPGPPRGFPAAGRIALLYLAGALVWFTVSHFAIEFTAVGQTNERLARSVQGAVFILGSAAVLYVLIGRELARRRGAEGALRRSLERERESLRHLREVDDLKQQLLTTISHRIRTPLTAVIGFVDTLARWEEDLSPEHRRTALEAAARNAGELEELVDELLDAKRLSSSAVRPERCAVDVADLVRRAVQGIVLEGHRVDLDLEPVTADVDPGQVGGIVTNLVENAVQHSACGAPIRIVLRSASGDVEFRVDDRGPGVPDDRKMSVFQAFEAGRDQAHDPPLGLGLFLAARYAELHGGRVWVQDAPNGGASFRVRLPGQAPEPLDVPVLPDGSRPSRRGTVEALARVAHVAGPDAPTADGIRRRRREVYGLLIFAIASIPVLVGLTFVGQVFGWLPEGGLVATRILLVLLAVAFAAYAYEKERALGRLSEALEAEKALRTSFEDRLRELAGSDGAELSRVADEAMSVVGGDHATLMIVRGEDLVVAGEAGAARHLFGRTQSLQEGIAGFVARTKRPLLLRDDIDFLEIAANLGYRLGRSVAPPRSSMSVPVAAAGSTDAEDDVVAVLNVNVFGGPRYFDGDALRRLTLFAQEAAELVGRMAAEPAGSLEAQADAVRSRRP